MKKALKLLVILSLAFVLVGCKTKDVEPGSIAIKTTTTVASIGIGDTLNLTYSVLPVDAKIDGVIWSVNDATVATISEDGVLNGISKGVVKVTVTVKNYESITISKYFSVTTESNGESYPDLGGYTIKIADGASVLGEHDVFINKDEQSEKGYYDGADRNQKKRAWTEIEDLYNCNIEVVAYPANAPWGPDRWAYIVSQFQQNDVQYDFYVTPTASIPLYASANAIQDLTSWYDKYGNNTMNQIDKMEGSYQQKIYSLSLSDPMNYNVLGYNVNLLKELQKEDSTLEEPAQLYLDGKWSYTDFQNYVQKVQTIMNSKYGLDDDGNPNYYAISGMPTYYWLGMVNRAGIAIIDTTRLTVNFEGETQEAAADVLKTLYAAHAIDPAVSVDQNVASWNAGHSLFNSGDLWFVNRASRWSDTLWGEGTTSYGYVPYAAPDGYNPDMPYIGIILGATQVMATGREEAYAGFGDECTAENIYRAYMNYYTLANYYYTDTSENDEYNRETVLENIAQTKFATIASQQAFVDINNNIGEYGFLDPYVENSNPIVGNVGTGSDTIAADIEGYINGTGSSQWTEAVSPYTSNLNESMTEIYG